MDWWSRRASEKVRLNGRDERETLCFQGFTGGGVGASRRRRFVQPARRQRNLVIVAGGSKKKNAENRDLMVDGEELVRDVDVVLCHTQADYDTLAAAVGLAKLRGSDALVVLSGGSNPAVERFLGLFRPMFPIRSPKSIDSRRLRYVGVVDTVRRDRLGPCAEWPSGADAVEIVDHHIGGMPSTGDDGRGASGSAYRDDCDIMNVNGHVTILRERVGAATTLVVEKLMHSNHKLTPGEATLMALGIHTDTGSLTFENTTARDARALAWLLEQGANQLSVAEFKTQQLTDVQMEILNNGLQRVQKNAVNGVMVGHCLIQSEDFVKGLSVVAQDVMQLSNVDVLLFCVVNNVKHRNGKVREEGGRIRKQMSVIGRAHSRVDNRVDLNAVLASWGGGGHAKAAAVTIRTEQEPEEILQEVLSKVVKQIPAEKIARDFMSTDYVVCRPEHLMSVAREQMIRNSLSGLPVVGEQNELVGTVLQTDVWTAEKQNRLGDKVSQFMRKGSRVTTITAETTLPEAEQILATGKAGGPLPVLNDGHIVGLVTRIDVLRARHLWSPDESDLANDDDDSDDPDTDDDGDRIPNDINTTFTKFNWPTDDRRSLQ